MKSKSEMLIEEAEKLRKLVGRLVFSLPVTHVYNPLEYAWESHRLYLSLYGNSEKRVIFLGMNPGPWGMAQTGVPFGEIQAVKKFLKIEAPVEKPLNENPKRPVTGFQCTRSEVSGRRFWGFFEEKYGKASKFFSDHFVGNYCPLVFMESGGRNVTPDKLKASESKELYNICDMHLKRVVEILKPEWVIGVGRFTEKCAQRALNGMEVKIGHIMHPSPASPAANNDWAGSVSRQLNEMGLY